MAPRQSRIKPIVQQLVKDLAHQITVDKVFVFGSAARGTRQADSDIDLMIISKNFRRMPFMQRLQLLSRASWNASAKSGLDLVGYTPEEFKQLNRAGSPMLKKIKREGYFIK